MIKTGDFILCCGIVSQIIMNNNHRLQKISGGEQHAERNGIHNDIEPVEGVDRSTLTGEQSRSRRMTEYIFRGDYSVRMNTIPRLISTGAVRRSLLLRTARTIPTRQRVRSTP